MDQFREFVDNLPEDGKVGLRYVKNTKLVGSIFLLPDGKEFTLPKPCPKWLNYVVQRLIARISATGEATTGYLKMLADYLGENVAA